MSNMFSINVHVDVNLGPETQEFIKGLFMNAPKQKDTADELLSDDGASRIVKKPKQKDTADELPSDGMSCTEKKPKQKNAADELPFDDGASCKALTADDIRVLLAQKINKHRPEIKQKLTELGAASVTALDTAKYPDMYEFLNGLA